MFIKVWIGIAVLLLSTKVHTNELPSHWPIPLTTSQVEAWQSKQSILSNVEERIVIESEYIFSGVDDAVIELRKATSNNFEDKQLYWELAIIATMEILGLIDQYHDENFDFTKGVSLKVFPPRVEGEPGYDMPPHPDQIKDPQRRALYIKEIKETKAHNKRHQFESSLKYAKDNWMRSLTFHLYGKLSNSTGNALDSQKAQPIKELILISNTSESFKHKLQFLLTMMMECDKSLIKKALEKNDQSCAEHVKQLEREAAAK